MTEGNQGQEREYISLEALKARGGANTKFFELLERHSQEISNDAEQEAVDEFRKDFKKEWNSWVEDNKTLILDFSNFNFNPSNNEVRNLFTILLNKNNQSEGLNFSEFKFPKFYCETSQFYGHNTNFSKTIFFGQADIFLHTKFFNWTDFSGANFYKGSSFELSTFCEKVDFTNVTFSGYVYFIQTTFPQKTYFTGAIFKKLDAVPFEKTIFSKKTDFSKATFEDNLNLSSIILPKNSQYELRFNEAVFTKEVTFNAATFPNKADFTKARFNGAINFINKKISICTTKLNFKGAIFTNRLDLSGMIFKEGANFSKVVFEKEVNFNKVTLSKELNFKDASFDGRFQMIDIICDPNSKINLQDAEFNRSFKGSFAADTQEPSINIDGTSFAAYVRFDIANLQKLPDLSSACFPNASNLDLRNKKEKRGEKELVESSEENFRFLKKYYKEKLDFDKSHFYFTLELERKKKNFGFWKTLPYLLYEVTSNYGKSIKRPFFGLLASFFIFGLIFLLRGYYDPFPTSFARTIYPALFKGEMLVCYPLWILGLQTLVNTALWFLLLLGVKNKFQIK